MHSTADHPPGFRLPPRRRAARTAAVGLVVLGLLSLPALAAAAVPATPTVLVTDAQAYSVLGGAVTSTGDTALGGSLGVTPGTALTGFGPGSTATVAGSTEVGTPAAARAASAARTAYDDATGRTATAELSGTLSGQTLLPGTYHSGAALTMAADTVLTLDGRGDPSSTFVLQVGGALSLGAGSTVRLVNGAHPAHVFWATLGAVTVGAGGTFAGTILTPAAVTVSAGASVQGRVLSLGAAVTLGSNAIGLTMPALGVGFTGGPAGWSNAAQPTITGASDAAAGSPVTVTGAGAPLSTAVRTDGTWSVTPAAALASGPYDLLAAVTDTEGAAGSAARRLTVKLTGPALTLDGPATRTTNQVLPAVAGSTDEPAGTTVTVGLTGPATLTGWPETTTAAPDGRWSVAPGSALAEGTWTVTASVTDRAGSTTRRQQTLVVDTTAPVVTLVGGSAATTASTTASLAGQADGVPVGTAVSVSVQTSETTQSLTTTVGDGGGWTVTLPTLAAGRTNLQATVTDLAGNTGTAAQSLVVNEAAPVVTILGGGAASSDSTTPTLAGAVTRVPVGTTVVVTATAGELTRSATTTKQDGDGWTVTLPTLPDGSYTVVASVTDAAGNTSTATQALALTSPRPATTPTPGPAPSPVTSAAPSPTPSPTPTPAAVPVTITGGPTQSPLYKGTFVIRGTAAALSTVTLHFRRAGAAAGDLPVLRTVTAAADGTWSRPLVANADYTYFATAGTGTSGTVVLRAAPTLDGPTSRVVPRNRTVTLTGSALPGSTVYVRLHRPGTTADDFSLVRSVVADGRGRWTRPLLASVSYRLFVSRTAADGPAGARITLLQAR